MKGTVQTVAITQRLAKIREAQDLKIQADAARQKEVVIKARLQPWLDEEFAVSTTIEYNVAHMQIEYAHMQIEYATTEPAEIEIDVLVTRMERIQQIDGRVCCQYKRSTETAN